MGWRAFSHNDSSRLSNVFHVPTAFNRVDGEILHGNSRVVVVFARGNGERYKNLKGCLRKALPPRDIIHHALLEGLLYILNDTDRSFTDTPPIMPRIS